MPDDIPLPVQIAAVREWEQVARQDAAGYRKGAELWAARGEPAAALEREAASYEAQAAALAAAAETLGQVLDDSRPDARIASGLMAMLDCAGGPALTLGEDEVVTAFLDQLRSEGLALSSDIQN